MSDIFIIIILLTLINAIEAILIFLLWRILLKMVQKTRYSASAEVEEMPKAAIQRVKNGCKDDYR